MAQKRPSRQTRPDPEALRLAALALADAQGWDAVTPAALAKKTRLKEKDVSRLYADRWAVVADLLRGPDARKTPSGAWRDALFDACMARVDLADAYRQAFLDLPIALLRDKTAWARLAPAFCEGMTRLLKNAGAPATPLHTAVFSALYLSVIETWRRDDTPDRARTMAALDRRLSLFEKLEAP